MKQKGRPSWDKLFLNVARTISKRATCPRASVGAVIVKDNHIVSCGYNGAPAGEPHCVDVGCEIAGNHCQRAIHAETNAVAWAARIGISVNGATLYYWDSLGRVTTKDDLPLCVKCYQVMKAAGIERVIWNGGSSTL